MINPKVLIIDEPTKGIDIGSRVSIYEIIDNLTRQGIGILMLTSDMVELIGLSDRTLVFYEGRTELLSSYRRCVRTRRSLGRTFY